MRSIGLALIVGISLITLLVSGAAFAARSGGERRDGGRGGYRSGAGDYYRGGEHHGGYYRGGEHHGNYRGDWGHRGHYGGDWDVVIGGYWGWGPWWGYQWPYYNPYYYPYYYQPYPYYYTPSVVVPEGTQTYIEQQEPQSSPTSSEWPGDWFYCPGSKSFYPYVKECPGGWKTVPAKPPSESGQVSPSKSSAPAGVWYYCPDSKKYYPYVEKCPGGWHTVPAKPPAGSER